MTAITGRFARFGFTSSPVSGAGTRTGVGTGVGVGDGVAVGVGVGDGLGDGDGVAVGVGDGDGLASASAGDGDGDEVAPARLAAVTPIATAATRVTAMRMAVSVRLIERIRQLSTVIWASHVSGRRCSESAVPGRAL